MAGAWDKIKQKLEQGAPEAKASDWEAMHKKIAAQPALNRQTGIGLRRYLGVALLVVAGLGAFWYFYSPVENVNKPQDSAGQNQEPSNRQHQPAVVNEAKAEKEQANRTGNQIDRDNFEESDVLVNTDQSPNQGNRNSLPSSKSNPSDKANQNSQSSKGGDSKMPKTDEFSEGQPEPERNITAGRKRQEGVSDENQTLKNVDKVNDRPRFNPIEAPVLTTRHFAEFSAPVSGMLKPLSKTEKSADSQELLDPAKGEILLNEPAKESNASSDNEEDIYNPYTGFKLRSISLAGKFLNDFNSPGLTGWQAGVEAGFARGNWLFNTGLYYGVNQWDEPRFTEKTQSAIDSFYIQEINTRVEDRVRAIWVIDSFFAGHYELDTVQVTITDTTQVLNIDTTRISTLETSNAHFRSTYVEMPITTGYRFPINRFALDLSGGVLINQLVHQSGAEGNVQSDFGMNLLFQPALHYRLNKNYSLFVRGGLRYNMLPNAAINSSLWNYDFQVGIALGW